MNVLQPCCDISMSLMLIDFESPWHCVDYFKDKYWIDNGSFWNFRCILICIICISNSYCEVVVEVINTNDEPPVFQGQSYEFNIIENIPDPYYVGFINVTDADSGLINLTLENCRGMFCCTVIFYMSYIIR